MKTKMLLQCAAAIVLLSLLNVIIYAQTLPKQWNKRLGGTYNGQCMAIRQTRDKGPDFNSSIDLTTANTSTEGFFTSDLDYKENNLKVNHSFNGNANTDEKFCNACANPTFVFGSSFTVGTSPQWLATADFNEDGKTDIAVANRDNNNVSVVLGDGQGNFGAPTFFSVGSEPHSVAVGDFNKDGHLDLATANLAAFTVSVLLGDGTGSFGTQTTYGVGQSPRIIIVGDWNKDQKLDLAFTNQVSNTVGVMLGNGDGTFQAMNSIAVGNRPVHVTGADYNNDGKTDLAVSNRFDNNISILLGDGAGSFVFKNNISIASLGSEPFISVPGDFNHDGNIDLAIKLNVGRCVVILLGDGTGFFNVQPFSLPAAGGFLALSVGDFNNDGNLDVATDKVTGDATIQVISLYLDDGTGSFSTQVTDTVAVGFGTLFPADFNIDGKLDLATTGGVYLNQCTAPDADGDGVSDSCDACPNNSDKILQAVFYHDVDNDGYGNPLDTIHSCSPTAGYVSKSGDCNDNSANVHPNAIEICGNGIDDNCNGQTDEGCCANATNLTATNLTSSSAKLNWTATVNPARWQVQYKKAITSATWTNFKLGGAASSTTISSLSANQTYKWRIRAKCGTTWTAFSSTKSFKTLPAALRLLTSFENITTGKASVLRLYPNPSTGIITVQYNSISNGKVQLKVVDMAGKTLYSSIEAVIKGANTYHLNLPQLASGVYNLELASYNKETNRVKFVIQK